MNPVIRVQKTRQNSYVLLDGSFLDDSRLTWAAKGVLAYLLSRPAGQTLCSSQLVNDGRDDHGAIEAALSELRAYGYVVLNGAEEPAVRDANGSEEGLS